MDSPSISAAQGGQELPHVDLQAGIPPQQSLELFREDGSLKSLEEIELEVTKFHLEHHEGDMSATARTLGIGRSTLYRKLDQFEQAARGLAARVG